MQLGEIDKLTNEELRQRADDVFALADEKGPGYLAQAQFYISELDRRENRKMEKERDDREKIRWRVDFALESLIVILILVEIGLSISDHKQYATNSTAELKMFTDMQGILTNLRDTSKATADTMKEERQTMEAMKISLERQVELFYDVQINVTCNEASKKLILANTGRANITLWAQAIGEENEKMLGYPKAVTITTSATYEIPLLGIDVNQLNLAKNQAHVFQFTFFVKNEKQERFTISGDLIALWKNDVIGFNTQQHMTIPGWKK
jgi:hypothetical protein